MAVRRASVCLFCQARRSAIGRRRAGHLTRLAAGRSEEDGVLLGSGRETGRKAANTAQVDNERPDSLRQQELQREVDALRAALLDFEAFQKHKDTRLKVLRGLSNPWPDWNEHNKPNGHLPKEPVPNQLLPEARAAPVPHSTFRRLLKEAQGFKAIRLILRAQLLRCETPKDVMRVTAVAMQSSTTAKDFAALSEPIIRAMYRCRNNVSDPQILRLLKMITTRFNMAGLHYDAQLLFVGLKFAARSRSLQAMKHFLHFIRRRGRGMSSNIFRSVIAKFSIGHRGLGEIRNGRWRRDDLLQVLKGFSDCEHLPPEEQFHLGSFMQREDWQYLHGWVAVLARCRDSEGVWAEWEWWKHCEARLWPRGLNGQERGMNTRLRGDYWFVEQMSYTGDLERAWRLVKETGVGFRGMKKRVKSKLLEHTEYATVWNEDIREAMVWKYDIELSKIETALGVRWQPSPHAIDEADGTHILLPNQTQEESLERLAATDLNVENDYGFPYDDEDGSPIVESHDRKLQEASEHAAVDLGSVGGFSGYGREGWVYGGPGLGNMSREKIEEVRRKHFGDVGDVT